MSTSTKAKPNFARGGEAAEEAAKFVPFARGNRLSYLSLKDKESILVRYITDWADWITVAQHSSCPTKSKPADFKGQHWPEIMTAVCRKDKAFEGIFDSCYICDEKITNKYGKVVSNAARTWALCVEREEVFDDEGKRVGTRDKVDEVEVVDKDGNATGEKVFQRRYLIVNFAHKNYFSGLAAAYAENKTVCDRDFRVTRTGDDTATNYSHFPLDATPNLKPGTDKWQEKYLDDLAEREIDLADIVFEKAQDEYYERFFIPGKGSYSSGSEGGSTPSEPAADEPVDAATEERVSALRDRIRNQSPSAADVD